MKKPQYGRRGNNRKVGGLCKDDEGCGFGPIVGGPFGSDFAARLYRRHRCGMHVVMHASRAG